MNKIQSEFDPDIDAYVVRLPCRVSLDALRMWGSEFLGELGGLPGRTGLLFDSNTHNFESIDCLRWLKEFFTKDSIILRCINRIAFVNPMNYRSPEIVSESEAYFTCTEDARKWLRLS